MAEMEGQGVSSRKVTAIGIDTDGKRSVLGCGVQLSEISDDWETERAYLNMESR